MSKTEGLELWNRAKIEELSKPSQLEELVQSGRVPLLVGATHTETRSVRYGTQGSSYNRIELTGEEFIFIPPVGTLRGDSYRGSPGLGYEFFSPEGKSRGLAECINIDRQLAKAFEVRINETLGQIIRSH